MDTTKILTHLIRAGRDALNMENQLRQLGYDSTPYYGLYGEIAEAVYCIMGEKTESFDESVTHAAMHDPCTTDKQCAEALTAMLAQEPEVDLSDATKEILMEVSTEKGIELPKLLKLIISEWAARQFMFKMKA